MFGLSSVWYGSFSVRVNFRSIISGLSSGMISVRSVRVIRVGSLLPGLTEPDPSLVNPKLTQTELNLNRNQPKPNSINPNLTRTRTKFE